MAVPGYKVSQIFQYNIDEGFPLTMLSGVDGITSSIMAESYPTPPFTNVGSMF